jgi:hypothetical protein
VSNKTRCPYDDQIHEAYIKGLKKCDEQIGTYFHIWKRFRYVFFKEISKSLCSKCEHKDN